MHNQLCTIKDAQSRMHNQGCLGIRRGCVSPETTRDSPVNEVLGLQVGHAGGDLLGHVQQRGRSELVMVAVAQVVEQVAVTHELHDHVQRRLASADTCHKRHRRLRANRPLARRTRTVTTNNYRVTFAPVMYRVQQKTHGRIHQQLRS